MADMSIKLHEKQKAEIERETRFECARIAALESKYWAEIEDERPHMLDIAMGAMGAAANIAGALFMGRTAAEVEAEIKARDGKTL